MTAKLHVIRINLPGHWADGWLYKEHLLLWNRTGELFVVPVSELLREVSKSTSRSLAIATEFAIFRNDWKASQQFRRLGELPGITEVLLQDFTEPPEPVSITLDRLSPAPVTIERIPGFMLDVSLYANHLYVGSTDGLFEARFSPDKPREASPVIQRLNHRVSAINAKYSAINASADEEGLLFGQVDFDDARWWSRNPAFTRTAETSYDNSFASFHLLNYMGDSFPTFLRARTAPGRPQDRAEFQESQIVSYQAQTDIRMVAAAAIQQSRKVSLAESQIPDSGDDLATAEVLGNSGSCLLIRWQNSLQVVDISASRGRDIEAKPNPHYRAGRAPEQLPAPILSTCEIKTGFLVELADEIRLMTPNGSFLLASERAARVRTFIHARRYQDAALIVGEESVSLYGFFEVIA